MNLYKDSSGLFYFILLFKMFEWDHTEISFLTIINCWIIYIMNKCTSRSSRDYQSFYLRASANMDRRDTEGTDSQKFIMEGNFVHELKKYRVRCKILGVAWHKILGKVNWSWTQIHTSYSAPHINSEQVIKHFKTFLKRNVTNKQYKMIRHLDTCTQTPHHSYCCCPPLPTSLQLRLSTVNNVLSY